MRVAVAAWTCAFGFMWADGAGAQAAAGPSGAGIRPAGEQGERWSDLKPAQREALKPLEREWAGIDASRKQKWIALSGNFKQLSPEQQGRVQARMAEWARLSPRERGEARLRFQEAKQLPLEDREARWKAYQALTPEQKEQLAARAAAVRSSAPRSSAPQVKSNIVPNPELAMRPRPIGPIVVQAGPGATTTLLTRRPTPPSHQQSGMPKIAATPEFVNRATLLPQRGPQSAAAHPAAVPSPEAAARK
ncbi:MAG: DUF3106 domain-containing protein [Pseudomonadota bacterium]|nr:DUF3106 domain-containing protein [Pseudomonadota bacterium]